MASAEENILLSRLLDLLREDPDRIRSFVQAGTSHDNITNNSHSPNSSASSPATDSPGSRSSDPEVDLPATNSSTFTADELLKPRSRRMKATAAQQTFAFILREAAKKCEIWESAPHVKDIPAKNIAKFEKKVTKELPQLAGRSKEILRRLSVSLIQRRNHLNNTKYWKRAHQIDKYKGIACNRPHMHPKDGKSVVDVVEQRLEGSGFVFKSAEDLLIMDGDIILARATYIRHAARNSDYVKVVLQSVFSKVGETKIPLSGLNSERWLQDIKVGQKFYWPENQVVKASRIKSTETTKKKNSSKSRKNKKVKAGEGDGVVAGEGGNVEDVAAAKHVLADGGKKKKKKNINRAESTTGVEGVVAGDGVNVGKVVTVAVAAEGKEKKKKKNKRAESTTGVESVVADIVIGDDVVADDDVTQDDVVTGAGGDVADDDVTDNDVLADDDVVGGDNVVDDDVEALEGATVVMVGDEGKKKEAGKKRKKPSWEYVPIVAEVEERLPPKRRRLQKKNEDFLSY